MEINKKKIRFVVGLAIAIVLSVAALIIFKDFIFEPIVHPVRKIAQTIEYGIVTDSFKIDRDEVKPGENLGSILTRLGVDKKFVGNLNSYTDGVFNLCSIIYSNIFPLKIDIHGICHRYLSIRSSNAYYSLRFSDN